MPNVILRGDHYTKVWMHGAQHLQNRRLLSEFPIKPIGFNFKLHYAVVFTLVCFSTKYGCAIILSEFPIYYHVKLSWSAAATLVSQWGKPETIHVADYLRTDTIYKADYLRTDTIYEADNLRTDTIYVDYSLTVSFQSAQQFQTGRFFSKFLTGFQC